MSEITPEMIEAGVKTYEECDAYAIEDFVRAIFTSMEEARRDAPSHGIAHAQNAASSPSIREGDKGFLHIDGKTVSVVAGKRIQSREGNAQ